MPGMLIIYDAECPLCVRARDWISPRIPPDAVEWLPCQSPEREDRAPAVTEAACREAMQLVTEDGSVYAGAEALRRLVPRMTRPWRWFGKLFSLPGAPRAYAWVARRRLGLSALLGWNKCRQEGRCPHGPFGDR